MSQRLRVVYIDHVARLSGGELALLRLLAAVGSEVDAWVILGEDGPLTSALSGMGVRAEVLPLAAAARDVARDELSRGFGALRNIIQTGIYVLRLARRLRRLRPDLVHTNSLKSGFYGCVAARLAGVPVIWHVRDRIADDYMPAGAVRLTRLALRLLPNVVVCNSEATAETVGRSRARSAHPVVYDPYRPSAPTSASPSGFVVGMVGRLAPWKGQALFIRAFAAAFPVGTETAKIVGSAMFGEDDYAAELVGLVTELGLCDRIEFTGFVEDVESQLRSMSVLVHASLSPEPFGQVVIEGMAAGLAVVAADEGGPAEVISDGVDGLLFRAGDVTALSARLGDLREDDLLRQRLGRAGAARAADFSPEAVAPAMLQVYARLAPRGPRRRRAASDGEWAASRGATPRADRRGPVSTGD